MSFLYGILIVLGVVVGSEALNKTEAGSVDNMPKEVLTSEVERISTYTFISPDDNSTLEKQIEMSCNKNRCTCWFDGWFDKDWGACCETHDISYYLGNVSRAEADRQLLECVKQRGGWFMAQAMYLAVRMFGWYAWRKYRKGDQYGVQ